MRWARPAAHLESENVQSASPEGPNPQAHQPHLQVWLQLLRHLLVQALQQERVARHAHQVPAQATRPTTTNWHQPHHLQLN